MRELAGIMEMLFIMIVQTVTQLFPLARTQQKLKLVSFILYKLHFNRAGKKQETSNSFGADF